MPNTSTRIYIHLVFAVLRREAPRSPRFGADLDKHMTGTGTRLGHQLLQIGGRPDHVPVLIGMKPMQALSTLVEKVKSGSSLYLNNRVRIPALAHASNLRTWSARL